MIRIASIRELFRFIKIFSLYEIREISSQVEKLLQ